VKRVLVVGTSFVLALALGSCGDDDPASPAQTGETPGATMTPSGGSSSDTETAITNYQAPGGPGVDAPVATSAGG
jgi:hypothetical protein